MQAFGCLYGVKVLSKSSAILPAPQHAVTGPVEHATHISRNVVVVQDLLTGSNQVTAQGAPMTLLLKDLGTIGLDVNWAKLHLSTGDGR